MGLKKTAAVMGLGPNGLVAAITLAGAGVDVTVYEANPTVGGGARFAQLTLSGFVHDVCSAVYPLGHRPVLFREVLTPVFVRATTFVRFHALWADLLPGTGERRWIISGRK